MTDELDRLMAGFFQAVSFQPGEVPHYEHIRELFIGNGLLIKNSLAAPEILTVDQFVASRSALFSSGQLTSFKELELIAFSELFGNVAQRFGSYEKQGVQNGTPFTARGMISTQFISTPDGWKISAMAWDDERPGLNLPPRYAPTVKNNP